MSDARLISVDELGARLRAYSDASMRRDMQLLGVLAVLLAVGFLVPWTLRGQPLLFRTAIGTWVTALAGLALYIVTTTRSWHREHGVHCPHCRRALGFPDERLTHSMRSAASPTMLVCPSCEGAIASNADHREWSG